MSAPGSVNQCALLSVEQCYAADRAAEAAGIPSLTLMENAGRAVTAAVRARFAPCPVAVLCGPGNNGGDGFVVARRLTQAGWPVRLGLVGDRTALKGDAAIMAARWPGAVEPLEAGLLDGARLIIDALFGAGLARPLDGRPAEILEAAARSAVPVVAADVPSGLAGDSGIPLGPVCPARLTVTFFRRKPGHVLLPGRALCGELVVADIGIPDAVLAAVAPRAWVNGPEVWERAFPWPGPADHKYTRGHALVVGGGPTTSGAGRLAARAALRAGSGLVTTVVAPDAAAVHAAHQTAVMITVASDDGAFERVLGDPRRNAILIGPGAGVTERTRARVLTILAARRGTVLDADALTCFAEAPDQLFGRLDPGVLLTPHDGEFARLFRHDGDRLTRARAAAAQSGAVVLLKGADTAIAAPDGRAVINDCAPPWLATAGAGDVLAGIAVGLMAQGLDAFEAGAAAAWLHGVAAGSLGPGLTSEDLVEALPKAIDRLAQRRGGPKP